MNDWPQAVRAVLNRLPAPALLVFKDGDAPFANKAFCDLGGDNPADAVDGKTWQRLRDFAAAGDARKISASGGGVRVGDDWTHGVFYFLPFADTDDGDGGGVVIFQPGADEPGNRDYLTGLANRREAESRLQVESARAHRHGRPFCLALGDIDFFKNVNDRLGHDIGDDVLCHIARVVEGALRAGDWCARWGGEEFLLFIADSDAEAGMLAVERVRRALLENPPPAAGGELSATMSFGVAVSTDHQKYQDMIAEADLLLYESKRRGRNRISVRQDSAGPALWKREQIEKALAAGLLCARCVAVRDCQTDGIAALYAAPFLRGGGDGILRAARMARSAEIQGVLPEVDIAFLEAARRDLADAPAPVLIPLAAKTLAQNTAAAAVIRYVEDGKPPMVIGASALSAADDDALRNLRVIAAHGAPIFLDDVPPASPPFSVIAAAPFSFILFSNRRRRRADATTKTEAAAVAPPARLDSLLRAAFTAVAEGGATKTILAADAQEAKSVAANLYRPPDNPAALEDILKPDKDKK